MTTVLEEVPGARERPGGCRIRVVRGDDGGVTLFLPPPGVSPVVLFFSLILLGNLLVTLYTGLVLTLAHRSVLFMAQISPGGLPFSLRHWDGLLLCGLLGAEALGFWTLAAILRPIGVRESVQITAQSVIIRQWGWGRARERRIPRADLRGFLLRRDPQGLNASRLTAQGAGDPITVGEFLREADREWLASAANALLRLTPSP